MYNRQEFLNIIKTNINKYGYHITFVNGGQNPNYAYTIGLYEKLGFELVIAGGYVSVDIYEQTFELVLKGLNSGLDINSIYGQDNEGKIELLEMHSSWKKKMILGVYDYFSLDKVVAFQITPIERLLDIPNMSVPWDQNNPIWCWLEKKWNKKTPKNAYAITNIPFLKGETVTEVMRWEDGYWEMFVGDSTDVPDEDVRIVPIGTMIGVDESLKVAIDLEKGNGIWRETKETEWIEWR